MTYSQLTVTAIALAGLICPASAEGIVFGPVRGKAGESVRLLSHSATPGGTISKTLSGATSNGSILITRDRDLVWTFRDPAADGSRRGMVKVNDITTTTKVTFNGTPEEATDASPLKGKLFSMSKPATGDWKFELDGSVPLTTIKTEIDELTVYLKRNWYPVKAVELGESWEFDPAWIKMVIHKDLPKAQTIGTMRLRQVRRAVGRELAVIDISIRSTGSDFLPDGTETSATIDLSGQVTVNLQTMLDESLELTGTITTGTDRVSEVTKVQLPIKLTVTKSFVRDGQLP
ncbi:MAG: hypothetical protein K9N23_17070 [Akkermansiaceae bacterium]|nr:hypothetical protein [Akkermansiaceae bacterium]MCF7733405.1 hypothetical protein [Akkermansiaceae bacterium]